MSTVAIVDVGTNSTRLLVRRDGQAVTHRTVITRLGQGVDRTRRLDPEAIERTLAVLRDYRAELDGLRPDRLRAVATSAARDAANRDDFFGPAAAVLGVPMELLTGEEEGRAAFAGATSGLPGGVTTLVVDIGGGSTELVVGDDGPVGAVSLDIGAVRLTEGYLHGDPPRADELSNAISVATDEVEDALRRLPELASAARAVGVGGTITTVAAVELGFYDRAAVDHFELTKEAAEDVFRTLATERLADRVHNPGLQAERADIIVGGCAVLVAVMRRLRLPSLVVSEADLLDGLALELERSPDPPTGGLAW